VLVLELEIRHSALKVAHGVDSRINFIMHVQMTAEATAACTTMVVKGLLHGATSRRCLYKRPARPEQVVKLLLEEAGRDEFGRDRVYVEPLDRRRHRHCHLQRSRADHEASSPE